MRRQELSLARSTQEGFLEEAASKLRLKMDRDELGRVSDDQVEMRFSPACRAHSWCISDACVWER